MDLCPSESLSVSAAASYIGELTGHRPNPATVARWIKRGRLRSWRLGRRLLTDRRAVVQLLESFNAPPATPTAPNQTRDDVRQAGAEAHARILGTEA